MAASQTYDALGRTTAETNVLGTFTCGYDGVTRRLASVTYPNGQTSTYAYLDNAGDHRLQTIHHKYPDGATLSTRARNVVSRGCVATMSDVATPILDVPPTGPRPSTRRSRALDQSPSDHRSQRDRAETL